MDSVTEQVLLAVFKAGTRMDYQAPIIFSGRSKDFEGFDDPKYTEFAADHGIDPQTMIDVWKKGSDSFGLCKQA